MKISVIIPCYNAEKYISDCIDSVLAQTHDNIELICVDNNSTDNTLNILKTYATKYPEKFIILQEFARGATFARNKGLLHSKGEWLQFLDADDVILPNKLKNQINLVDSEKYDLIIGNYYRLENEIKSSIYSRKDPWIGLIEGRLGCTCSNLWKKDTLIRIGMWDNIKSSQEAHLMFKMLKNRAYIIYDDQFNTVVRMQNKHSITKANPVDNWIRYIELRIQIWEYLKRESLLSPSSLKALKIIIFRSIRILHSYDPKVGVHLYKKYIKGRFSPIEESIIYMIAFKLLGFKISQLLSKFITK